MWTLDRWTLQLRPLTELRTSNSSRTRRVTLNQRIILPSSFPSLFSFTFRSRILFLTRPRRDHLFSPFVLVHVPCYRSSVFLGLYRSLDTPCPSTLFQGRSSTRVSFRRGRFTSSVLVVGRVSLPLVSRDRYRTPPLSFQTFLFRVEFGRGVHPRFFFLVSFVDHYDFYSPGLSGKFSV